MATTNSLTTVAFIYKRDYSAHQVADITMRDHVWYTKIHKEGGFGGDSFLYAVTYGAPQGVSGTFTSAQSAAGTLKGVQFRATRAPKFGVITLDGESILAAKGNSKAFYDLVTKATDAVLMEVGDSLAFDFYRDTYGTRGRISSINSNTLTLTEAEDARNFKEGMTIIADDISTGASPRSGSCLVTAVNEDGGTITVDSVANITSLTANDYLFRSGDPGTCMEGLEVCTPLSAPTYGSDSFRGVDRGVNPSRLAGSRLDDTSLPAEIALGRLAVKISKVGRSHNVDEAYLNPTQFFNAAQRLNAKVEYSDGGGTANHGFQFITIHTAAGSFRVYSDPDCPITRGRVTRDGSQYIKHLEGLPHFVEHDGLPMLRQTSANGVEARVEAFCNLIQDDTAAQGVCSLSSS